MEHTICMGAGKTVPAGPQRDMPATCNLQDVPEGAQARVLALEGCARVRSRLCSLGFTPGTRIMVYGKGPGGCRVQVRDTCVVLDCAIAANIVCEFSSGDVTLADACGCSWSPEAGTAPNTGGTASGKGSL